MYKLFYILMVVGFSGLVWSGPELKTKIIGALLLLANMLIFYKS